ncbi:MAG: glutamine-hydrolyzing carbamoyl-phosphate synthase small subunit, partial [Nitrospinota bacterium]
MPDFGELSRAEALLALEDGRAFRGESFGSPGEASGEVVFNTSMTGYQEVLTDPSYRGQMVVMTYPHIGNYGVTPEDEQSGRPWVEAFVVREGCADPSNFRAQGDLESYLHGNGIVGIQGIDTRAITRHIRELGALKAMVSTEDLDPSSLSERARRSPGLEGRDLVKDVTCPAPYFFGAPACKPLCVAYDFGVKRHILELLSRRFDVQVVPAQTTAGEALSYRPRAVFLSNGPGDPAAIPYAADAVRGLIGQVPVVGICLGHQLISLALGGRTFKLKFGHHGANQPVKDLATGKVDITAQNHSFAVETESLPPAVEATQINLNDGTCEGLKSEDLRLMSVQYHPEASPGPHDAEG